MSAKKEPGIEVKAVAKAMDSILPSWRKVAGEHSADGANARDELVYLNEKLADAFYKSEYARRHIGWEYAAQLIYAVLQANTFIDGKGFAEQLNKAVANTSHQRDLIVVVPLGFTSEFGFSKQKMRMAKGLSLGSFKLSTNAQTAKALNKILVAYAAAPISPSDFQHQSIQSHNALVTHPLLTFEAHGSIDSMRHQATLGLRHLIWLIELFGRVFEANRIDPFGHRLASKHIFFVNKHSGALTRVPSPAPLTVSLSLSAELTKALRRPELTTYLQLLGSGSAKKSFMNRLRNALNFFGRAANEGDRLTRFLFYVIAMEAIFSRDKQTPIKVTLADYATLLCFGAAHRREMHAELRTIYDVRSEIVHSGVSTVDPALLAKAEKLAARAIYCSLALAASIKDEEGGMENRFFERLLEMKLGVSSSNLKLPPWKGFGSADGQSSWVSEIPGGSTPSSAA